jgi:hypothetical protein
MNLSKIDLENDVKYFILEKEQLEFEIEMLIDS